jgi:hypothetical protein
MMVVLDAGLGAEVDIRAALAKTGSLSGRRRIAHKPTVGRNERSK